MAQNNFDSDEVRRWFTYCYECWWCGKNHWNCGHHIDGRRKKFSNSLLNFAPLNNEECHLPNHGKLKNDENITMLLRKTFEWLMGQGYELTELDKNFIESRKEYYADIIEKIPVESY